MGSRTTKGDDLGGSVWLAPALSIFSVFSLFSFSGGLVALQFVQTKRRKAA